MARAMSVEEYLDRHHVAHEMLSHGRTGSSLETARVAHVPPERVAKGVLLTADGQYVLAVTRADCQLDLDELERQLQTPVGLATRNDIQSVFADCEDGAVPPLGPAYGLETIWDEELAREPDLYFELGDHTHLVHMRTHDYLTLLGDRHHAAFSERPDAAGASLWTSK